MNPNAKLSYDIMRGPPVEHHLAASDVELCRKRRRQLGRRHLHAAPVQVLLGRLNGSAADGATNDLVLETTSCTTWRTKYLVTVQLDGRVSFVPL